MSEDRAVDKSELLSLTAEIVASHVSNNPVSPNDLTAVIQSVFDKLSELAEDAPKKTEELVPAVPIKKSVHDDYIVCLEDGKKLKMLKRHLKTAYNMTPDEYRAKWGLSADYPMVAPAYARKRQELARKIGLGRKPAGAAKGRGKAGTKAAAKTAKAEAAAE
ncbi:MucR family transcriptional regulator [Oceanicella actignis]|uniref:MucR family transcriptional regulator n=1 Tax=Oceanicella actignis TaxID=1189325 RepID=UPI0011E7AAE0|nr:MucR family transcriptional regulator [Oceanicella actignis]TYO89194.1 MucR family transcriptional regulator [Oceanicella actignis]